MQNRVISSITLIYPRPSQVNHWDRGRPARNERKARTTAARRIDLVEIGRCVVARNAGEGARGPTKAREWRRPTRS
jgi:hypothetical protein